MNAQNKMQFAQINKYLANGGIQHNELAAIRNLLPGIYVSELRHLGGKLYNARVASNMAHRCGEVVGLKRAKAEAKEILCAIDALEAEAKRNGIALD